MCSELASYLNQALGIGNKVIPKRLVLSPMTYLGHIAFRELVARFGGYGLLFSEMCSAARIPHENRFASPYFQWRNEERAFLVCQIFGADPKTMASAAQRIEKEGLFGVDINFGCSTVGICRQNCGAALLRDPDLAAEIVTEVRKAASIPLFVKFRTGWSDDPQTAVDLAKRFEDAGADALTFHPRVAPDRRSRPPRWEYIARVKRAVSIPVFGNGNVFDRNDCKRMLQSTGCDGVALGRMAIARPWIFAEWTDGLTTEPAVFLNVGVDLARLLIQHFDETRALRRFKRFAFYYSANFRYGHTLYKAILNARAMSEIEDVFYNFFKDPPDIGSRPNMNFFT